ncbi:hypothetical protein ACP70R_023484 [Stipagrostis hirtigluma subsp. patula]
MASPTVANAHAVAMDAKVTVASGSSKPSLTTMHPLLLAAACKGNWEELNSLLDGEDAQALGQGFLDLVALYNPGENTNGSLTRQTATADIEEGANVHASSAMSLLEDTTAEGDTILHVVASMGDNESFLKCATSISNKKSSFMWKHNKKGNTPLHCAARAGKTKMVTHLIDLARSETNDEKIVEALLRQENESKETALHEAIRTGDNHLVQVLLRNDPELACFPKEGSSPLYLAILLKEDKIAQTLHDDSKDEALSYSGPNGQNALHAAVLRGRELTRKLLEWKKDLAAGRDENGSTPLHFAAGMYWQFLPRSVCRQLLKANSAALYQSDNQGLFPIHVAASVGADLNVTMLLRHCPSCAGFRDAQGRTFLHVAVEKSQSRVVIFACKKTSLEWIMNMQDNKGNTALHLAVKSGNLAMFSALYGNRHVHLNLENAKGQTPIDMAHYMIHPGLLHNLNSGRMISFFLGFDGARSGVSRVDHFKENYENIHGMKAEYDTKECELLPFEKKEFELLKESTQSLSVGSVLIATVTFGATFALPGGYRQDDHPDGGTPTLAGRYAFHAFMMANTIAFIGSCIATVGFMYAGSPTSNFVGRKSYFFASITSMHVSIIALTVAFALGVYTVLAPVAQMTAIAICVMSPLVVLYNFKDFWMDWFQFARSLCIRKGLIVALGTYIWIVLVNMVEVSLIFILIFVWAKYGRNHHISKLELPAQPPAPLT